MNSGHSESESIYTIMYLTGCFLTVILESIDRMVIIVADYSNGREMEGNMKRILFPSEKNVRSSG